MMNKIKEGITKVLEDTDYSRQSNRKWLGDTVLETRPNRIYGVLRKNVFKFRIWETPEKFDIYGFDNIEKFIQENKGLFCWYVTVENDNNKTNYIQTDDFYGPLHNSWGIYKLKEGIDVKEHSGLNHYNRALDEENRKENTDGNQT